MDTQRKLLLWKNCIDIDPWCEHGDFPLSDWQHEVANDYTRQAYIEWVCNMIEMEEDMEDIDEAAKRSDADVQELKDCFWAALGGR